MFIFPWMQGHSGRSFCSDFKEFHWLELFALWLRNGVTLFSIQGFCGTNILFVKYKIPSVGSENNVNIKYWIPYFVCSCDSECKEIMVNLPHKFAIFPQLSYLHEHTKYSIQSLNACNYASKKSRCLADKWTSDSKRVQSDSLLIRSMSNTVQKENHQIFHSNPSS